MWQNLFGSLAGKLLFVVFLFFFSANELTGQDIQLRGVVSDSLGPLGYANVIASDSDSGTLAAYSITNDEGRYALKLYEGRTYLLRASFLGYETQEKLLNLTQENSQTELNFILKSINRF